MEELRGVGSCMFPPELDDVDLIAAVDEEAAPDVVEHLASCPFCAARAQSIAELQGHLRQRLYRLFCPTSDELAAYSQAQMVPEEQARVASHLTECSRCVEELELLAQISAAPPARPPGLPLRRVVANPQHPDSAWPHGSNPLDARVYRAGMIRIVLSVERQHGSSTSRLRGQMSGGRRPALTASLLSHGRVVSSVSLDDQGSFILDDFAPGDFSLSLRLPDYEVIVEALRF